MAGCFGESQDFTSRKYTGLKCTKPVTCPLYEMPIAQWLEHLTSFWEVEGSIPAGGSDFFSKHIFVVPNTVLFLRYKIIILPSSFCG